ncbi:hypothetical protein [Tessaracoccus lapidicaptus]|uniref:hypothetical protein n=1 Tax=Tessaracoccus lapidicaptus TaxID=1427523 RepID=UPI003340BF23
MNGPANENWPVTIKITAVRNVLFGEELPLYLMVGTMNLEQWNTLIKDGGLLEELTSSVTAPGLHAVAAVLTRRQLQEAYDRLEGPSRSWRGQYYSLTQAFVAACREALQ